MHGTGAAVRVVALQHKSHSSVTHHNTSPPTLEMVMIPLVPTTDHAAAPFAGWSFPVLFREMFDAWVAHHQRMADLGVTAEF
jgi:hypothetical protein